MKKIKALKKPKLFGIIIAIILIIFLLLYAIWGIYLFKVWRPLQKTIEEYGGEKKDIGSCSAYIYKNENYSYNVFSPDFFNFDGNFQISLRRSPKEFLEEKEPSEIYAMVWPKFDGSKEIQLWISSSEDRVTYYDRVHIPIDFDTLKPSDKKYLRNKYYIKYREDIDELLKVTKSFCEDAENI